MKEKVLEKLNRKRQAVLRQRFFFFCMVIWRERFQKIKIFKIWGVVAGQRFDCLETWRGSFQKNWPKRGVLCPQRCHAVLCRLSHSNKFNFRQHSEESHACQGFPLYLLLCWHVPSLAYSCENKTKRTKKTPQTHKTNNSFRHFWPVVDADFPNRPIKHAVHP